ncbi:NYN domain-containing protein [Actinocorallia libanotica]|uniref:NYN domain-containing protein n=1 Tax=Actinocorallia libanotica TaxID=46162 RepID=A0ABN1R9L3_9ACTN
MTKSVHTEGSRTITSDESLSRPLPEAVRRHVVEAAAEVLGALPLEEVPVPLRRVAKFRPQSRARQGAASIAAQLERDPGFRARVTVPLREEQPELVAALEAGDPPPAADPVRVAALAYLLRPEGWASHVETARAELERSRDVTREAAAAREVAELREQLAQAQATRGGELDRLRGDLKEARGEIADLRRKIHEERRQARAPAERLAEAERTRAAEHHEHLSAVGGLEKELKALRGRLVSAETALEAGRKAAREGRSLADIRLRLLLDTLVDAAQGVRRELNLPAVIAKPADHVSGAEAAAGAPPGRSLSENDPQQFSELLTLPQVHLIVDGYNVTKTGYGELPLADQRGRLVNGLGGLYSQTQAEITVVFDGASLDGPVAVQAPRGVRVLFSRPGQIADELIAELVRAEPPGRPFVVVSSDQEVAASARRAGGRTATARLLLKRLGRF